MQHSNLPIFAGAFFAAAEERNIPLDPEARQRVANTLANMRHWWERQPRVRAIRNGEELAARVDATMRTLS